MKNGRRDVLLKDEEEEESARERQCERLASEAVKTESESESDEQR